MRSTFFRFGVATIVAVTGYTTAIWAMQQSNSADDASAGMTSNVMDPVFDPDARLRAAQAASDPAKRVEMLARPGRTQVELDAEGHRAQAVFEVVKVPALADNIRTAISFIGDDDTGQENLVLTRLELRVDGCLVDMPPTTANFADPRRVSLERKGGRWTLEVTNNGDGEAYTIIYTFDARSLVGQQLTWGGNYDARWKVATERYGEGRECIRVGPRRFGARAELAVELRSAR